MEDMAGKLIARVICAAVLALTFIKAPNAQEFYAGKTIQIIVGLPPGGGFDLYARLLARHMGKYIPGNPNFVVMNMPGAGSMNAVNHLANIVKPDGLTMATFIGTVVWNQVFDQPGVQFDARQLRWLGIPAARTGACVLAKSTGIATMAQWKAAKKPVELGAAGVGTQSDYTARIVRDVLGMPIHVVAAYAGSNPIRLAIENGEVGGVCLQWEAILETWRYAIEQGEVYPVLQFLRKPHPDLPQVPLAISLAKNDEDRELLTLGVENSNTINAVYALPPHTPDDRVALLRKAFVSALRDPAARAEADTTHLDLAPVDGQETETLIRQFFTLKPAVHARLQAILFGK
jgi:tripartite-type tricarboxylate transporter receptor subunit TctC